MDESLDLQTNEIIFPSIIFQIKENNYCVNSRDVSTILRLPEYRSLPTAPDYMTGIFVYRGDVIQMLDLRTLFGKPTQVQECDEFVQMLDQRKHDHVHWVQALEHSIETQEPFTLATDPHKCAFGKWYDTYSNDSDVVRNHLNRIDEPHRRLHLAAVEAMECQRKCDECQREICLQEILRRTKEQYMPLILKLLDETKDIFRERVYREMVLIVGGDSRLGLVVDEVVAVEELTTVSSEHIESEGVFKSQYLTGIKKSARIEGIIPELDIGKFLNLLGRSV